MTAGSGRSSGDRRGRGLYGCHVKHDIKRGRYECTWVNKGVPCALIVTIAARTVFIFVPAIKRQALLAFQSHDRKPVQRHCCSYQQPLHLVSLYRLTTSVVLQHTRIYTNLSHQALKFGTVSGLLITGQNPMRSTELLSTAFLCKHTNYIIRSTHKGGHVHYHIHQIAKTLFNCTTEFSWKARRPLIHTIGDLPGNYNKRPIKTANIYTKSHTSPRLGETNSYLKSCQSHTLRDLQQINLGQTLVSTCGRNNYFSTNNISQQYPQCVNN